MGHTKSALDRKGLRSTAGLRQPHPITPVKYGGLGGGASKGRSPAHREVDRPLSSAPREKQSTEPSFPMSVEQ